MIVTTDKIGMERAARSSHKKTKNAADIRIDL